MAWNGLGLFTRTNGVNTGTQAWQNDRDAGTKIRADRHDTHDQDLASGINACLTKNGETKPTASFLPNVDNTYDLGSASLSWRNAYIDGSLYLGGTQVVSSATDLNKISGYTGNVADLNILAGASAAGLTAAELLYINTLTSNAQNQLNDKATITTGTFVPKLQDNSFSDAEGQTYNYRAGSYSLIGDTCFFDGQIILSSLGSLFGNAILAGLPFNANAASLYYTMVFNTLIGANITAGQSLVGRISSGTNYAVLLFWNSTNGNSNASISSFINSSNLYFSGHYKIA